MTISRMLVARRSLFISTRRTSWAAKCTIEKGLGKLTKQDKMKLKFNKNLRMSLVDRLQVIQSEDEVDEFVGRPARKTNYVRRLVGPWVVGLYENCRKVRFFTVSVRKTETLSDIARRSSEKGSITETDERRGHSRVCQNGCIHTILSTMVAGL